MKRMVSVCIALTLAAGAAFAQAPDSAYVALMADAAHSVRQVNYGGGPGPTIFTMYIWWLPSVRGINAAEFAVTYPANVISTTPVGNNLTIQVGTLTGGISIAWAEENCQTTWVYSHTQTCYLTSAAVGQIMIVDNPTLNPPAYQVASCELGYPIESVKRWTHLYINWDGGLATESRSWGAIKSLF